MIKKEITEDGKTLVTIDNVTYEELNGYDFQACKDCNYKLCEYFNNCYKRV